MGGQSPIIQAAQFAECLGAKRPSVPKPTLARSAPVRLLSQTSAERRDPDGSQRKLPRRRQTSLCIVTFKGGGDATAAGRAVMETGEFDYAWNMQLAPTSAPKWPKAAKGTPFAHSVHWLSVSK